MNSERERRPRSSPDCKTVGFEDEGISGLSLGGDGQYVGPLLQPWSATHLSPLGRGRVSAVA